MNVIYFRTVVGFSAWRLSDDVKYETMRIDRLKVFLWLMTVAFVYLFCHSCNNDRAAIQTGQLFFCAYHTGELSEAIDAVTQTEQMTHYSHMGLIERDGADTFLIHASSTRGVVREKLSEFITLDQPSNFDIYELPNVSLAQKEQAIRLALQRLGQPYNASFIMNDQSAYCSQLVYSSFARDSVFQLEPMTFKDPKTDEFNAGWLAYFEALSMPIPEGAPGCNPNGMIANSNLRLVQHFLPRQK